MANPPKQPGLAVGSSGAWGAQRSSWLPAFLCHPARTLLLSTCHVAALPSLLLVLLGETGMCNPDWLCLLQEHGSCLSSSLLRSFLCPEECHMELSTSCHPCCFLLRFLKNKWTDFISVNRLLGWQQHVKKIIAKSLERLQPKDSRPGV